MRPKGQLWLPVTLIGTTAEENGNCIRRRYESSGKDSDVVKLSNNLLDFSVNNPNNANEESFETEQVPDETYLCLNLNDPSDNEAKIRKGIDKVKENYSVATRNTKVKSDNINGEISRGSSVDSVNCDLNNLNQSGEYKMRSLAASIKRSKNSASVNSVTRKKKLSPEEKLLQDNKEYFKMEVLNTKLRSTGSLLNVSQNKGKAKHSDESKVLDKIIIKKIRFRGKRKKSRWSKSGEKKVNNDDYETMLVNNKKNHCERINGALKKKRESELMKLCNEAESFMFGESSKNGTTNHLEIDSEEYLKNKIGSMSSKKRNSFEDAWIDRNGETEGKTRKKRRSHAEAFIHDNLDYYKFETPESRLRYQGNLIDIKSKGIDFIKIINRKKKEKLLKDLNPKKMISEKYHENIEIKEKRTENFDKKKDVTKLSEEIDNIFFSFESAPVTEPWYEVFKRQDEGMENYYPLLSDPNDQPFLLPYELPKPIYPKISTVREYYKKRKKKFVHLFNHPRKSPRCHASTLAILSSLKKRKRRSGTNILVISTSSETQLNNISNSDNCKYPNIERSSEASEEILNFLHADEADYENEILLEPFSDMEDCCMQKNITLCKLKNDKEEVKSAKTSNRVKKIFKTDSVNENDSIHLENQPFSWQMINSNNFFQGLTIQTQKKSALPINIVTILENFKNSDGTDDFYKNMYKELNEISTNEGLEKNTRRKKRKARKINKTGWDNRKSRRRTGNKAEVKEVESAGEEKSETEKGVLELKQRKIKTKVVTSDSVVNVENSFVASKRRVRRLNSNETGNRPVLRSKTKGEGVPKQSCQKVDFRGVYVEPRRQTHPSIVSSKTTECSSRRCSLQSRRLVLNRKKKKVRDYAWNTKKR